MKIPEKLDMGTGMRYNLSYLSGCGSAWLERLVWDQEVAGSNPVTPIFYSYEPGGSGNGNGCGELAH